MPKISGPEANSDATKAYLFLCLSNGHYAVSKDRDGNNLPRRRCAEGWKFIRSFTLGMREPLAIGGNPEPVIRAVFKKGYYISAPALPKFDRTTRDLADDQSDHAEIGRDGSD